MSNTSKIAKMQERNLTKLTSMLNAELEGERRPGDADADIYKNKPPKNKKKPRKKSTK